MDFILSIADEYLLDRVWARLVPVSAFVPTPEAYAGLNSTIVPSKWSQLVSHLPHPPLPEANAYDAVSAWPRDYIPRQMLSLTALTLVGIHLLYFAFSWLSYTFIFDKRMMRHPKFLKDQVRLEIITSLKAFPVMMLLTLPWFQAEVMGYSRLYDDVSMYGWPYLIFSVALCVVHSSCSCTYTDPLPPSGSSSSPTTVYTGYIAGCTSRGSTSACTSRITSGLVSFPPSPYFARTYPCS